jgi:hypothetical protein
LAAVGVTRPAWQRGRNYDVDLLTFSTATPGFILGEAIIGTSLLGDRGTSVEQDADFTSITVDEPTTVDDGMFVHREVAVCTMTATLPERVALRGQWIELAYDGHQLFEGRVSRAEWTETVDVGNDHKPGNSDSKTYRVQLTATTGEEKLATTTAQLLGPDWEILDVSVSDRVEVLTGYPVTVLPAAVDLPLSIWNQDWETGTVQRSHLVYDNADRMTLLDALRRECRAGGYVILYQPRATDQVVLLPVNRWLTGSTAADALAFTDEVITAPTTHVGDEFLTTDRRVSYTARQVSEDPSLFTNSVILNYQIDPDLDGNWTELTYGPYPLAVADAQQVVVDYGRVKQGAFRSTGPYDLARAIVQTFPVKQKAVPYPSALAAPMQSVQQIDGTVPGMALMTSDGSTEQVAVLGRTHQITPSKWLVSYKFGPPHLLTRTSDYDPGPAIATAPTVVPGVSTTFHWTVPDLPTDAAWFEVVFKAASGAGSADAAFWYTSTTTQFTPYQIKTADPPGTVRSYTWTGGTSGDWFYVAYTTNVNANWTDVSSDVWREGQPAILGQQSH